MTPTTDMLFAAVIYARRMVWPDWNPSTLKKKQLLKEASKIFNTVPIREAWTAASAAIVGGAIERD